MSQTALLALDGEGIAMQNMLVSPSMQFQEKDQSGQTSSTTNSEQGIKAKELRVSGLVTFDDEAVLQRLFQLASATETSGALKTYRVANATATAINFREATFTGQIDAVPQETASPGRSVLPCVKKGACRRNVRPAKGTRRPAPNRPARRVVAVALLLPVSQPTK